MELVNTVPKISAEDFEEMVNSNMKVCFTGILSLSLSHTGLFNWLSFLEFLQVWPESPDPSKENLE